MSYIPINEENQLSPTGQTTPSPIATAPPQTTGSAGEAPSGPKTASAGSPTQFGSSASKLGAYLEANAPQITQQADTIVGGLNQQYGNVSQGITNAANQFGQQVQGGYAAANPDLVSQAMQDPASFASNPENVQAFQNQYNNAYTGPLAFEGTTPYSDIQNQVGQAVQHGNLLGSQAGLQSYLQGQGPNPTRASASLDALLFQGNPEAQAKIRGAANQLGTLGEQLQTATKGANALVAPAQQQAQTSQTQAREATQTAVGNLSNQVQDALNSAITKFGNNGTFNAIQAAISNGDAITPEQAQLIGIDPARYARELSLAQQMSSIYNNFKPSLADYFTPGQLIGTPPTVANVATPDMYAKAAALRKLTGGAGPNLPFDPTQVDQAGTFNPNVQSPKLDLDRATSDIRDQFSNADLNWLLGTHAGPTDALIKAANMYTVGKPTPDPYNPAIQAAAQAELPYLERFGASYYPKVDQRWVDTLKRLASNPY